MGGSDIHDTTISNGTKAWIKSNKLYQSNLLILVALLYVDDEELLEAAHSGKEFP